MRSAFDKINEKFEFDARSLFVFRVGLGLLLFIHLLKIYSIFPIFFSNQGVLRQGQFDFFINRYSFPLFFWLDGSSFGRFIIGLSVIASALVALGKWTKPSLIFLWIILNSLLARNPLVHHAGDGWLILTVFLSIFLPIGRAFPSLEGTKEPAGQKLTSPIGFIVFSQIVFAYFFAGLAKTNPLWINGYGVSLAFTYPVYAKPLAQWILEGPTLILRCSSWLILFTELCLSPLLWCWGKYWKFRMTAIAALIGFHLACYLTLTLDFFPWLGIINLNLLIPSNFWDLLCGKIRTSPVQADPTPKWKKIIFLSTIYPLFFVLFVLNGAFVLQPQINKNKLFRNLKRFERFIGFRQNWYLFAGYNIKPADIIKTNQVGIFYVSGKVLGGGDIYLNDDKPELGNAKPTRSDFLLQDYIWHRYFDGMRLDDQLRKRAASDLASYYCKKFDNRYGHDYLKNVKVDFTAFTGGGVVNGKELPWSVELVPVVEIKCDALDRG